MKPSDLFIMEVKELSPEALAQLIANKLDRIASALEHIDAHLGLIANASSTANSDSYHGLQR